MDDSDTRNETTAPKTDRSPGNPQEPAPATKQPQAEPTAEPAAEPKAEPKAEPTRDVLGTLMPPAVRGTEVPIQRDPNAPPFQPESRSHPATPPPPPDLDQDLDDPLRMYGDLMSQHLPSPAKPIEGLGLIPVPGGDASVDKEPATWRSKSKPPMPMESPIPKVSSEPRRWSPRASRPEAVPSFDLEGESAADVAPVGPTETASARLEPASAARSSAASVSAEASPSAEEIETQIHDLEARLDRMIRQSRQNRAGTEGSRPAADRPRSPDGDPGDEHGVTARELLSTDFYLRQWSRIGMRNRSEEVDEFGLDPKYEARYKPFFDFLYKHYFRVDTRGTESIPETGRCLIVSNHSGGALPYDGIMLRTTVRHEHPKQRELRWLAEDFIYYLPFVGAMMNRIGAVRACQENAERLLAGGRLVAVFPEGAKGTGKLYRERYRLQRFGRGGFIRLCLRTQTPLVPCAIIGAEEANPMLYRIEYMTKALGIPYLPITPTFPALGPLGLLPAPTKWKVRFGEPVSFDGYGPEAADDDILVGRLAERVRTTIQGLIDKALEERQSIWFG